jgi:hypothetical protein
VICVNHIRERTALVSTLVLAKKKKGELAFRNKAQQYIPSERTAQQAAQLDARTFKH